MPTSSRLAVAREGGSRPAVGSVIRLRIFSSVDLPAPFRPMMPTTSPCLISQVDVAQRPELLAGRRERASYARAASSRGGTRCSSAWRRPSAWSPDGR